MVQMEHHPCVGFFLQRDNAYRSVCLLLKAVSLLEMMVLGVCGIFQQFSVKVVNTSDAVLSCSETPLETSPIQHP